MAMRLRPLLDLRDDGVAVHDDAAMFLAVAQEWLADPAQVHPRLLVDPDAGPDPGVDEQIVAEAEGVGKAVEEGAMLGRDVALDLADRRLLAPSRASASGSMP